MALSTKTSGTKTSAMWFSRKVFDATLVRSDYLETLKEYTSLCQHKELGFSNDIICHCMVVNNSKDIWNYVKIIKGSKLKINPDIRPQKCVNYFINFLKLGWFRWK